MKAYKKIMKFAPIIMLGTSISLSPGVAFAEEKTQATQTLPSSIGQNALATQQTSSAAVDISTLKNELINRMNLYIERAIPTDDFGVKGVLEKKIATGINNWNPGFENGNTDIKTKNVNVSEYVNDNIELASYKNETSIMQSFKTPSKTEEIDNSFTYSNSEGVKVGVSSETKVGIEIPFVATGGEKITVSSEFNYNHTSSNTVTSKNSVTYPEQTLQCQPGFKTSLIVKTSKAKFTGSMEVDRKIINNDELNAQFRKAGLTEANLDLYEFYKASSDFLPLPSYITLDDQNHTVLFDKVAIPFTGVAGHLSEAEAMQVKLENNDTKKTITMPLKDYQNPQTRSEKILELSKKN
ncbi:TPA: ETX/MTX2 family pore-forming toxin [Bacillus cereus]